MQLVIETAGPACSVALFDGPGLVAARHEVVGRGHAERLIPMIAELPDGGRADAILVDCGPGSFTGIRVGLAAARGLALGWGVPVTGYSALALLAADHFGTSHYGSVSIAVPGGHGEVFMQSFAAGPMRITGPLASLKPEIARTLANFVLADVARLDARRSPILSSAFTTLPPHPIYGRDADAKPMA